MNSNSNEGMSFEEFQKTLKSALSSGDIAKGLEIIKQFMKNLSTSKPNIKEIIKISGSFLSGLKIDGYEGDFPTFIEPVSLTPGVKIGDTVLLGPNVIIGESCELGKFCELSNTILHDNIILGKLCKLNWCIVDDNITLPENFTAKECFITKNEKDELDLINL